MPNLSPEAASALLQRVLPNNTATVTWRWWRWFAEVSDEQVAFVADDAQGWTRLCREAALLSSVSPRLYFSTPSVLLSRGDLRVQVRRKVPGVSRSLEAMVFGVPEMLSAAARYQPSLRITTEGARLARELGRALAALHGALSVDEATSLGFTARVHAEVLAEIRERLAPHPEAAQLVAVLPGLQRFLDSQPRSQALCHRDIQSYNLIVDEDAALVGIFDFEDAGLDQRAEDFKFFPSYGLTFTSIALEAYQSASGVTIPLEEVLAFHLLSALEHFLFIRREEPRWPEIIEWATQAKRAGA